MRRYVHATIKMSLASIITILFALLLNLEFAITGGILAVLSIQLTRKDSVFVAMKRFIGALLALSLATILFLSFGYTIFIYSLITVAFIGISFALKLNEGIVPSLVLVSHLLSVGAFDLSMIINGVLLIAIAIAVALSLNMLYPLNTSLSMNQYMKEIDAAIIVDLQLISGVLEDIQLFDKAYKAHEVILGRLKNILNDAALIDKDILFDKDRYHMSYLIMRENQMNQLNKLFELFKQMDSNHDNAKILSNYVLNLSYDIGETDQATKQLSFLQKLLDDYRKMPLPTDRKSFELRAILFQMLNVLDSFLKEKIAFHERYKD
ncbi:MAG: aromatic acid exporter family protein [Candidatus Izemoplasmataceae bacterium]